MTTFDFALPIWVRPWRTNQIDAVIILALDQEIGGYIGGIHQMLLGQQPFVAERDVDLVGTHRFMDVGGRGVDMSDQVKVSLQSLWPHFPCEGYWATRSGDRFLDPGLHND